MNSYDLRSYRRAIIVVKTGHNLTMLNKEDIFWNNLALQYTQLSQELFMYQRAAGDMQKSVPYIYSDISSHWFFDKKR